MPEDHETEGETDECLDHVEDYVKPRIVAHGQTDRFQRMDVLSNKEKVARVGLLRRSTLIQCVEGNFLGNIPRCRSALVSR